jgi:hypothetical protein
MWTFEAPPASPISLRDNDLRDVVQQSVVLTLHFYVPIVIKLLQFEATHTIRWTHLPNAAHVIDLRARIPDFAEHH